jgi:MFS family permease
MNRSQRWTLVATVLASATVFLDSTIVNVALPRIGRDLPHSIVRVLEGQTCVYTGYLLSLSTLLILAGALTDAWPSPHVHARPCRLRNHVGAVRPRANLETLVVLRVLQGVAGAFLVPGSLALITAGFTGPLRGRAFGIWSGASSGTTLLGPAIGGVLVDTISWRAAFLINIPIIAIALYATWRHVPESRSDAPPAGFDWLGAIVVGVAVGGLAFGTVYGQQREWRDPVAYIVLGVGALATIALPFLMARRRNPLIPLSLFKSRAFTTINISTLLIYGALYALGYNFVSTCRALWLSAAAASLGSIPSGLLCRSCASLRTLAGRFGPGSSDRRPAGHGSRAPVRARSANERGLGPADGFPGQLDSASRLCHRPAATRNRVRRGTGDHGRPAHRRPDGLGAGGQRGPGVLDQQCDLAHRATARGRVDLRGGDGGLLHVAGIANPGQGPRQRR